MGIVYINGKFQDSRSASISIQDRGFLFGDGVFTTIRVNNGVIYYLEDHLRRLYEQCLQLNIRIPEIPCTVLDELININDAMTGNWRMKIIITGGESKSLSLPMRDAGTLLITLDEVADQPRFPLKLEVYPNASDGILSSLKTLSYLNRLHVKQFAIDKESDDALVVTSEGFLLETSFSNIFWILDNRLFTPSKKLPLLFGVTLQKTVKAAEAVGIEIFTGKYLLQDLSSESYVFLCNSIRGIVPVKSIGCRAFPLGSGLPF